MFHIRSCLAFLSDGRLNDSTGCTRSPLRKHVHTLYTPSFTACVYCTDVFLCGRFYDEIKCNFRRHCVCLQSRQSNLNANDHHSRHYTGMKVEFLPNNLPNTSTMSSSLTDADD